MNTPIKFIAPVAITAAASKGPRRFSTVAYTGGPLRIAGYSLPVVIDLAGLTTRNSVSANLDHDSTKRVGHVDDVQNDGRQLLLSGAVSAANAAAQEFTDSHDCGYPWQASVEVSPNRIEEIQKGELVNVNEQQYAGPLFITRTGVLSAVAFVPNGADDNTHVSIAAQRKKRMSDFQSWASECGLDTSLMTADQMAGIRANYNGRSEPIAEDHSAVAPLILANGDPVQAEEKRLRQIEAACRGDWNDQTEQITQLKARAVGGELGVDDLLLELRNIRMEKTMSELSSAPSHLRGSDRQQSEVISAAFCLAGGLENPEQHFAEPVLDAADKLRRDVGLQQIIMQAAIGNGYRAQPAEGITQGNIRRVLEAAFAPIRAAGFSTLSLPGILSNTGNKFLVDGWQETSGDEWQKISEVKPVKNFKTNTFYRLLESAEYEQVGPDGELTHGNFGEQTMTVQANTYGRMYAITRTDIINDDLGALTDVPRRLGRAAGMKFRRIYWGAFLAADSFFDSGNGNVLTGSGTALTSAGTALQTALTAFRAMRTSEADGRKLIGGKPAVLMVPPELELVGRQLLTSSAIVATGDTDTTMGNANVFAGLAELVVADWLSDSDLTGYSAAKWYLLRSPNIAPAMLVAFLNGQQSPTVETADADFNTLGIQMRGYHDFGVGRGEPLCGLQVAGSA